MSLIVCVFLFQKERKNEAISNSSSDLFYLHATLFNISGWKKCYALETDFNRTITPSALFEKKIKKLRSVFFVTMFVKERKDTLPTNQQAKKLNKSY